MAQGRTRPGPLGCSGSVGAAFALILIGLAYEPITAICACLLGGASLTVVLTKLYGSAQVALPRLGARPRARGIPDLHLRRDDRRQRCLGKLSAIEGLPIAYFVAGASVVSESRSPGAGNLRQASGSISPPPRIGAP